MMRVVTVAVLGWRGQQAFRISLTSIVINKDRCKNNDRKAMNSFQLQGKRKSTFIREPEGNTGTSARDLSPLSQQKCVVLEPTSSLLKVFHAVATMDAQLDRLSLLAPNPLRQSEHCLGVLPLIRTHTNGVQCLGGKHRKSRMPSSSDATLAYTARGMIRLHSFTGPIY